MFNITIDNFRSFQKETFNFSRINILIGENSSGKSSLLKFLLALKQSLDAPNNREYNFTFRGEQVDLGNYKESVYYNDDSKKMSFSFEFNQKFNDYFPLAFEDENLTKEQNEELLIDVYKTIGWPVKSQSFLSYKITKELHKHESISTHIFNTDVGELEILHTDNTIKEGKVLYANPTCKLRFTDKQDRSYMFSDIEYEKNGFMTMILASSFKTSIKKFFKLDEELINSDRNTIDEDKAEDQSVETLFNKIAFLLLTQNYLQSLLSKIDFINPINTKPLRFYINRDEQKSSIIKDIEDVVDFLSRNNSISKRSFTDLNKILKKFGLTEEIMLIDDDRLPVKELKVKIKDLYSNIMDVGYGVALQIPIIFKALLAERIVQRQNSIILIEQPEVHLHPKLHSAFIDTLLGLGTCNIYFIETHSEHIVRKLQVIVKNQLHKVLDTDISINYLDRQDGKTVTSRHYILKNGQLSPPFPSGFFDNSYLMSLNLI